MTPPPTIPFSAIELGERGRTTYSGIESLADSIADNGLIQPIVLVPLKSEAVPLGDDINGEWTWRERFGLDAGGRRYHALKLIGVETLFHATTSDPDRPGYILKGETFVTPLQRLMTEIAENLCRDDMDWRDQIKLIVKAYRLSKTEAHAKGEDILMRDYGAMIGVGYMKLQAAVAVHDDLIVSPERYKDVTSIRGAYAKLFKLNEAELTKVLTSKSIVSTPQLRPTVQIQSEPEPRENETPGVVEGPVMNLSGAFNNIDSLEFMASLGGPTFDHIVTDPDYGVAVERLESNMDTQAGVAQPSVDKSLNDVRHFIHEAWRIIKPQGFLVFWYDLDHHEKLQEYAVSRGFAVQRWPLIWHKSDYFSNAAPAYNFTKNMEYAMVCRKPNAVLSTVQKSSIFLCGSGSTARDLGHPFAKPIDVWSWIFKAVTIPGQVIFDPFAGAGSSCVAATRCGLKALGCELNPDYYNYLILNMQKEIRRTVPTARFT